MDALHIKVDDTTNIVTPKNGTDFSLVELQSFVDGYIQIVRISDNKLAVLNEEGAYFNLKHNELASCLIGFDVVGDVLVCDSCMVK